MIRNILSVIAGYLVFAITSVLLFNLTGHQPHSEAPLTFKLITIAYSIFFSIFSGFVTQLVAKQSKLGISYVLALVIFLLAGISLFTSTGSHWTQLFAMLIFAPVSILGGYLKIRMFSKGQ